MPRSKIRPRSRKTNLHILTMKTRWIILFSAAALLFGSIEHASSAGGENRVSSGGVPTWSIQYDDEDVYVGVCKPVFNIEHRSLSRGTRGIYTIYKTGAVMDGREVIIGH
ncbi:MAG: hypothetical protein ACI8XO_003288 [Verrucomicrobiales bacterium]|jgi:hypothetical protein